LRRGSGLDRVAALPVLALGGLDCQAHLLAQRTADESAQAVRLPAGGLQQLLGRGASLPLQQAQDRLGLAALADALLLGSFPRADGPGLRGGPTGRFVRFLRRGGPFPRLGLGRRDRARTCASTGFLVGASATVVAGAVSVCSVVDVMFFPLVVICAVTTSITPAGRNCKRNLDQSGTGDGTAMQPPNGGSG